MTITPRDAAFIGCRLLALYFLYDMLQWAPHAYSMLSSTLFVVLGEHEIAPDRRVSVYLPLVIHFLTKLAPMLLLWFGAGWVSNRIWPIDRADADRVELDLPGALPVVILVTGVVMMLSNTPIVAFWVVVSALGGEASIWTLDVQEAFPSALVAFLFGCLFVLGAGTIGRFVSRVRRW